MLLEIEWKLVRNDPFYIFLKKTFQFNQFYEKTVVFQVAFTYNCYCFD